MARALDLVRSLRFVLSHPLNRRRPAAAAARWLRWQVGSRLLPGASVAVPFVNGSRLLVRPGMTGATGNVYCGLHELEEMAFLLHLLRPEDQFVDVGANVGSYTVLASAAVGARTVAFEPVPATFEHLRANVHLNGVGERVVLRNVGVGARPDHLLFSSDDDTTNRVLAGPQDDRPSVRVPVVRLDDERAITSPRLVKIDVEGYEGAVLDGAAELLRSPGLDALVLELMGQGARYGFDEGALRARLRASGFVPCRYDPFRRVLEPAPGDAPSGNAILVRDPGRVQARLATAPAFRVLDGTL
ncbi:MAG: FkbM family methyltransferase [Planctomycetes bacterium]|nr:FkbM family methyltransferase [Planctomycetota bacterium]